MDKLKRHFLKIRDRFAQRRPLFERKIARWQQKQKLTLYNQAKLLFDDAESCEKEIEMVFATSDWKLNRAFLKVKINSLEELFKELALLTQVWWVKWVQATIIICGVALLLRNFAFGIYHVPTSSSEPTLLVGDRVWGTKYSYLLLDPKYRDMAMFDDPLFIYDKDNFLQKIWQKYIGFEVSFLNLKLGPKTIVKRVIAVPGDVIEGKVEDGVPVLYRNGKKLPELYINTYPLIVLQKEIGFFRDEKIGPIKIPDMLRVKNKIVRYSYDPKKDFEEQPFYFIDYQNFLYNQKTGYMKTYKQQVPVINKEGKVLDVFGPSIVPEGKYWVMGDNRSNSEDSRIWGFIDIERITGKATFVLWSLDSEEPVWFFEFLKNPFRFLASLRWNRFFKRIR